MVVLKPEAKLQSILAINGIIDLTQEIWTFSRESRFLFLQLLGECEERKKRSKGRTGRRGEREKEGRGGREKEGRGERAMMHGLWKRTILCLWMNVMLNKKLE